MSWYELALLSAIFLSVITIIDKLVVARMLRDRWSFPFFISLFLGLYGVALLVARGLAGAFRLPSSPVLVIALLPGVMQYASSVLYTRTLHLTDAATVSAVTQTTPLFAVLWGWIVFGERLRVLTYGGIALSVGCSVMLSAERGAGARRLLSPVLVMTLAAGLVRSLGDLFVKMTLGAEDYWNTLALSRAALLPLTLLLLLDPNHRRLLAAALRTHGPKLPAAMAGLEALALVPLLLSTIAYARGPLGPVSAIRYTAPLFVLALTAALNAVRPKLVPDESAAIPMLHRAALTTGILAGVVMIRA